MPTETISLSSTMEDYLERIYHIVSAGKVARVKEIAEAAGVTMASVTAALRTLSDKGMVEHDRFGHVDLTDSGEETARRIVRRHEVLRSFLVEVLGVGAKLAEEVACKMEHSVGKQVTDRLVEFAEALAACPRVGQDWLKRFHDGCTMGLDMERCRACIDACQAEWRRQRRGASGQGDIPSSELKVGERGVVSKIKGRGPIRRRLMDMGVVPGAVLEILQVAPLGDPIEVKLKGFCLALRRDEAASVMLKRL